MFGTSARAFVFAALLTLLGPAYGADIRIATIPIMDTLRFWWRMTKVSSRRMT
jgi:hypothetical protein